MHDAAETTHYLTTAEAARRWAVTPARARQIADAHLVRVVRLATGLRLFDAADVERLARERAARRGAAA
jgi:hypothetical protein